MHMTEKELREKEEELRECYCKALKELEVGGTVQVHEAKHVLMLGGLWHHAHELLKAHSKEEGSEMTAETMELKATGIRSIK